MLENCSYEYLENYFNYSSLKELYNVLSEEFENGEGDAKWVNFAVCAYDDNNVYREIVVGIEKDGDISATGFYRKGTLESFILDEGNFYKVYKGKIDEKLIEEFAINCMKEYLTIKEALEV